MRRSLLLAFTVACGGQTSVDIPPSSSDFSPPAADAVPYVSELGALANVSGGRARIGGFSLGNNLFQWAEQDAAVPTSLDIAPLSCSADASVETSSFGFGAEVIVAPFSLMMNEVTNDAYAICVDAGACAAPNVARPDGTDWRAPSVAQQPALVTWSLAHAFCRHYGGDLPTVGEYARATVGDAETYAQSAVLSLVLECVLEPDNLNLMPECAKLKGNAPLADVGTDPNDVGPFGHLDLYGNAWEWARGFFDRSSASFCASPLYEHDIPLTFPDETADAGDMFPPNTFVYSPKVNLDIPDKDNGEVVVISADNITHDPAEPGVGLEYYGFRCAFPTP